jgi:hypothetical protein
MYSTLLYWISIYQSIYAHIFLSYIYRLNTKTNEHLKGKSIIFYCYKLNYITKNIKIQITKFGDEKDTTWILHAQAH